MATMRAIIKAKKKIFISGRVLWKYMWKISNPSTAALKNQTFIDQAMLHSLVKLSRNAKTIESYCLTSQTVETSRHLDKQKEVLWSTVNTQQVSVLDLENGDIEENKMARLGLPPWSSGLESACQFRGNGLDSWSRRIPQTAGQISPLATATDLVP